jgi:predicted SAM-dependent methyltransferase
MKHHAQLLRKRWIGPQSRLYPALRWAYQPVKAAHRSLSRWHWRSRVRRLVAEYLAEPGFKGLHIGCGPFHLDGWLNTELAGYDSKADFPQDATRPWPFPDRSLDAIYAAEVIEHIDRREVPKMFAEARRVLRDGGVLRLTTPDVVEVCRLFLNQREDVRLEQFAQTWLDGEFSPEIWVNLQFNGWGHRHLWSFEELSNALHEAGFEKVVRCPPMRTLSPIPHLTDLETRYGPDAPPWLFARTLIVEAEKARTAASMTTTLRSDRRVSHARMTTAAVPGSRR